MVTFLIDRFAEPLHRKKNSRAVEIVGINSASEKEYT